jgi:peptidoglycan/LPS O-acetylase OafA/YrhL
MRVGGFNGAFAIAGAYLTLFVAFARWLPATGFAKHGDFSYGLYLYAFPIQQLVARLFLPNVSWWKNLLVAYPIALICAAASWHLVERPALSLKDRFLRRVRATRAPA